MFFFSSRRRHTRLVSDWSSDVCSSDLLFLSGRKETGVTERSFGTYENKRVTEYTLTNPAGMQVGILNYGGTVTKIIVPDRHRKMGDVVLGFESFDGYQQKKDPYFGSLVGRYANRIAQA